MGWIHKKKKQTNDMTHTERLEGDTTGDTLEDSSHARKWREGFQTNKKHETHSGLDDGGYHGVHHDTLGRLAYTNYIVRHCRKAIRSKGKSLECVSR